MSDDQDYYSTHDEIFQKAQQSMVTQLGGTIPLQKTIKVEKEYDLQDIRQALKFLNDKIANMDRFLRNERYGYRGNIMDGQAYRETVIKEFLQNFRDGKSSDEDKLLLGILREPSLRTADES